MLVAASCHNPELEHACRIGVDFVVLGSVRPTLSHAHGNILGWERFRDLARAAKYPCLLSAD